ncbi:MAG TPA: hypothetical protein VEC99_05255, partial [Clostridia bacterium]|nr:hypothetical protein [Clostridia bacterium]
TVTAWGDNSYNQCEVPAAASNVVAVAAGYYHSLALMGDGTVLAWGKGHHGVTSVPAGLGYVASIAAGEDFSLALVELGPPRFLAPVQTIVGHAGGQAILAPTLQGESPMSFQWFHDGEAISGATNRLFVAENLQGANAGSYVLVASNAVGQITNQTVTLSVEVAPYLSSEFVFQNVLVGADVCLAPEVLGAESLSYQWQLNGTNLVDSDRISGANDRKLCLRKAQPADSGTYTLIVSNAYGAITGGVAQLSVTEIVAWGDDAAQQAQVPAGATNIAVVAGGGDHSLALRKDGSILAWGDNSFGQSDVPDGITNVVAIAAGLAHSVALDTNGAVWAWGDNAYGQTNVPAFTTNVPAFTTNVMAIAAGANHTLALLADGTVCAWGANNKGQTNAHSMATNVIAIAAGGDQNFALLRNGTVLSWSWPSRIPAGLSNVIALAVGANHALALQANGVVAAWGNNYYGQTSVPTFVTNVIAIAAGDDHSLAVLVDGSVVGWGANYSGQCSTPAETVVRAVGAGRAHNLGVFGVPAVPGTPNFEIPTPAAAFTNGVFSLRLADLAGRGVVVIYCSTNLVDWEAIHTNPPASGKMEFEDPASPALPTRFYRAQESR